MEETRKKTYVSPTAVPVVFEVRDIVITSGGTGEVDPPVDSNIGYP